MKKIELLSPAGDLERLKIAVMYGADAVYIGGKKFSLRSRASNFDIHDIAEGVKFAKQYGAHVHVTVNMLPHEEDLEGLEEYLKELENIGVTAIISASAHIIETCLRVAPKLEVHVSTQHSSTNSSVIKFWNSIGVDRVVFARECNLQEIIETTKQSVLPVEAFIHGGMCISYSGRCTLSNHMTNRDANRGGCAQSCRWKYRLFDGDQPIYDETHLFSMSSKDMLAAKFIPQLIEAGVTSLKIEGRMKSAYYIATVVSTYRRLIDEYYEKGSISKKRLDYYENEFSKAENRPTSVGFYEGIPSYEAQLYGINGAGVTQEYIASVIDFDEDTNVATWIVRNNFKPGILAEVFGPNMEPTQFIIGEIYDEEKVSLEVANKPMLIITTRVPVKMKTNDMIRRIIKKDRSKIY